MNGYECPWKPNFLTVMHFVDLVSRKIQTTKCYIGDFIIKKRKCRVIC
jgi:hypothetical protein